MPKNSSSITIGNPPPTFGNIANFVITANERLPVEIMVNCLAEDGTLLWGGREVATQQADGTYLAPMSIGPGPAWQTFQPAHGIAQAYTRGQGGVKVFASMTFTVDS